MATSILLDCDPGHDDAIAMLLALASPELELLGVTTVAGNQTLAKTTANALRVLDFVGRNDVPVARGGGSSASPGPVRRRDVHGETASTAPTCRRRSASRSSSMPSTSGSRICETERPATLVPIGPRSRTSRCSWRSTPRRPPKRIVLMGGAIGARKRHAGRRVQHLGRSRGCGAGLRVSGSSSR